MAERRRDGVAYGSGPGLSPPAPGATRLGSLVALGPAQADHWAALRVGTSVAVPSLALIAAARPDLVVYVVFGAFTAMYGRSESHGLRLGHQARAALFLFVCVAGGVLLAETGASIGVLVVVESVVAGLGSLFADRFSLRPVGPFFGLFALGACSSIPTVVAWPVAIGLCGAAAAFALGIGQVGRLAGRRWQSAPRLPRLRPSGSVPSVPRPSRPRPSGSRAAAYVVAVALAGVASMATGIGHPHWAMAAAAVPLSATGLPDRLTRGVHRIAGTLVGLVVTAVVLLPVAHPSAVVLALIVVALQFPTELFMTRNYALALVFFTPLILVMTQLAHPVEPRGLLVDRAVETVGGAAIGMLVAGLIAVVNRKRY